MGSNPPHLVDLNYFNVKDLTVFVESNPMNAMYYLGLKYILGIHA